ncbi:uncharacterized protein LOC110710410 [Chenopodium quinoa]|uniref:uncharacterized protein LOC110710410 n=1 Tax=Chenopodium quinoa TaxID=63459 RepID=UPI000B7714BA|nr:uncharacterized protein LOC110710410 [Chenopodium quinoa]
MDTFRGGYDHNQWKFGKNVYNAAAGYEWLRDHKSEVEWSSWIWNRLNIPKMSFITWIAMWNRVNTRDRLKRFGRISDDRCLLYNKEPETGAHLFFACDYSAECSRLLCEELGLQQQFSSLDQLAGWMKKPLVGRFKSCVIRSCFCALVYKVNPETPHDDFSGWRMLKVQGRSF